MYNRLVLNDGLLNPGDKDPKSLNSQFRQRFRRRLGMEGSRFETRFRQRTAVSTLNPSGPNVLSLVWCESLERGYRLRCRPPHDHSSKLRGPSQNIHRVAAKWYVNIIKLN
ncbi:hypothetical protein AVEN_243485-1 [Araneus ventricosus]|uniref:Uncharacterized protein n=1 Tax=Araneus ventricosus TaxID=182803 RepID=A0A4Y2LJX4_ARAVE|nr:hypothetical protein AVEN_243485-1 [Araneus ventricosus]